MALEGLDPIEVKKFATTLDASANQIDEIRRLVTGQLHLGVWEGSDAEHMRHEWDTYYAGMLSACEQALHTLAVRARANADAQVEASNVDGGLGGIGIGLAILRGLVMPVAGELGELEEKLDEIALAGGGILDGLGGLIPDAKLAKLAASLPEIADTFHGVFQFIAPIALGFDAVNLHEDVVKHDQNGLAYDEVVMGLDTVSTALMIAGPETGPGALVLEPVGSAISLAAGVMSAVGMSRTAKDFVGGGIRLYEKPFIDDVEDPFRNPLETAGSLILNPQIAAPAIAVGVVHDGAKLLAKIL